VHRGTRKAHLLRDIKLPMHTQPAKEMLAYIKQVLSQPDDEESATPADGKSLDAVAAAAAAPPSIISRSWIACVQQPDALLLHMPDLQLTAVEQMAAEEEDRADMAAAATYHQAAFSHAPAYAAHYGSAVPQVASGRPLARHTAAELQRAAFFRAQQQQQEDLLLQYQRAVEFDQQAIRMLLQPPPAAQHLPAAVFDNIRNHYVLQLQQSHADFLQRVVADSMSGRFDSHSHLHAHFSQYVATALAQMNPRGAVGAGLAPAPAVAETYAGASPPHPQPLRSTRLDSVRGKGSSRKTAIALDSDEEYQEAKATHKGQAEHRPSAQPQPRAVVAAPTAAAAAAPTAAAAMDEEDDAPPPLVPL